MNQSVERPNPRRFSILDDNEIEALYGQPHSTPEERLHYFTLTPSEHDAYALFSMGFITPVTTAS